MVKKAKPGAVKPTRDDGPYENVFLNIGTKGDRNAYTRAVTARVLTHVELEGLYEGEGFARRIIDLPAEEMVRAGYDIEGIEQDEDVRAALEQLCAMERLCDGLRWGSLYGGALVVMLVRDGGQLIDPLDAEKAQAIEQLRVYDRWEVAHQKRYDDPADMRFGKTEIYRVSPANGMPYEVHESRCLVFDGVPVPSRIRERNDGWGASRLQQCYDQLTRFGLGQLWANALLERAQQAVHGIPDLTNLLRHKEGEALVRRRVDLVDMTRSINNTIVIDALETYDLKSTPLSGVADILDRLGLALSAVTGMPESLLFGRQQGGLNSTGKSDLDNWYAKVKQYQNTSLLPQLRKLLTVQLHVMKRYKDEFKINFRPLSVPSDKDLSEIDYRRAQTYEILANIGALDPTEIRKMLPDEGYDIEDIELVPETPADKLLAAQAQIEAEAVAAEGDVDKEDAEEGDPLREAQIDLLVAQAEHLRKDAPAPVPPAPIVLQPQQISLDLGGVKLEVPQGAIRVDNQPADVKVDVHVPQQKAPVVNVSPSTVVKQDAPNVTVNLPDAMKMEITAMPARQSDTVVNRDLNGEMSGSTTQEKDK